MEIDHINLFFYFIFSSHLLSNSVFVISDYTPCFEDYDKNINTFFAENSFRNEDISDDEKSSIKASCLSRSLQVGMHQSSTQSISLANSFPSLSNPNIWNDHHNTERKNQKLSLENSFHLCELLNFDLTHPLKIWTSVDLSSIFIIYIF
jgi:hypothetical protein